jgi:hypothetical protein
MQGFLKMVYQMRIFTIPGLVNSRATNLENMTEFLHEARRHALGDLILEPRVMEYLEFSDQCASSYDLSDDRTHGEHHKLDVVALGCHLAASLDFKDDNMLGLLAIALNEHDEGRRVTGDEEHEEKGARMAGLRMAKLFSENEITTVATAIGIHGGISVNLPQKRRHDRSQIGQILFTADKIAGLDPTRHTSYAIKKLGTAVDWPTFERHVIFTWHRALKLCRSSLRELEIDSRDDELAAEDSMDAVFKALSNLVKKKSTVGNAVSEGIDVVALRDWVQRHFNLELSDHMLPVYKYMF